MYTFPDDISLAFAPTPQTLWTVWGQAPDYQVEAGWSERYYQIWILASAGTKGLEEVKASMPNQFLAAAPFEQLLTAQGLLDEVKKISWWPSWLPSFFNQNFYLIEDASGAQRWVVGDKTPSGEKVLLEGHVKDFEDVIQTGQNIIKTSDYSKIISDLRPVEPGHPSDWFPMVKSPTTRGPIRHLLKDRIKE